MEEIDEDVFEPICRQKGLTYTCPLSAASPGESSAVDFEVRESEDDDAGSVKAKAAFRIGDTGADHADSDAGNHTRTFDLFGPGSVVADPGPETGVVVAWVLGGCVVLAGAAVLVRRKLHGR